MKANKFLNPGSAILILLLLWMIKQNFDQARELNNLTTQSISWQLDSTNFARTIDELGRERVAQHQVLLTSKQAEQLLKKELKEVKSLKSRVKYITSIQVDTLLIPSETVEVIRVDTTDYMKIPHAFTDSTEYLQFGATVLATGLRIDHIGLPNTTTITIGEFRKGFLRKTQPEVVVTNSNPYFQTQSMTNIIVDDPTPWYNTRVANMAFGAAMMAVILR